MQTENNQHLCAHSRERKRRPKTAKEVKKWLKESQTDMNVEVVLHPVGGGASADVHLIKCKPNKVYGIYRLSV